MDPGCARDAGLVSRRTHRLPRRAGRGVGDREPFTIHPDGTGLHQVTHFVDTVISHKVGFSPDGKWIVFGKGEPAGAGDVFLCKTDGTDLHPVTQTPLEDSSPDWTKSTS